MPKMTTKESKTVKCELHKHQDSSNGGDSCSGETVQTGGSGFIAVHVGQYIKTISLSLSLSFCTS